MSKKVKRRQPCRRPLLEEIEPRILYSADFAPGLVPDTTLVPDAEQRTVELGGEFAATAQEAQPRRHELVLVETDTPDYQKLVDDILEQAGDGRDIEVVLLDASKDGLQQITDILAARQDLSAVHLVSHGAGGTVELGATELNFDTLLKNATQVKGWGKSLSAGADILIYGCDVAQRSDGKALIDALARLTGADVAASEDLTGAAAQSGNWILEYRTGWVETPLAISTAEQFSYSGILATYTVTNTNDSGAGSLRQAILNANGNAGADTIGFNIPGAGVKTINVTSALPAITGTVVIDGTTQPGFASTPLIEIDGQTQSYEGLYLDTGSDGSTIKGLAINHFMRAILINASSNNVIVGNFLGTDATGTVAKPNWAGVATRTSNNIIGGTSAADRNIISGNSVDGIQITGASGGSGNVVMGNYIGLDVTGTVDLGNTNQGVALYNGAKDNIIGGTAAGAGNVISGNNGEGVRVVTSGTTGNVVVGNLIGTNAAGTAGIANSRGVWIDDTAANNTIGGTAAGAGNTIAYNTLDGVALSSTAGSGNRVAGNAIFSNGGLGIDLSDNGVTANDAGDADTGPNSLQNFPVLIGAYTDSGSTVAVAGSLNGTPNGTFRIEFFASPSADISGYGEGQRYLGFVDVYTDASGNASFVETYAANVAAGEVITATAIDLVTGSTSEFSQARTTAGALIITTTNDVVDGTTSSVANLVANKGADGKISLREAIVATNNTVGLDAVFVPAGIYTLSIVGAAEDLAANGDLDIRDPLILAGAGASTTTINGGGIDRVFSLINSSSAYLTGVTISGGNVSGDAGGFYLNSGGQSAVLTHTVLSGNVAGGGGLGGAIRNVNGTLTMYDVRVTGNTSSAGGGIYNNDVAFITNSLVDNNSAVGNGGGIDTTGASSTLTLANVTLSGNLAGNAGGGLLNGKSAVLENVTITNNTALTGGGLGVGGGSPTTSIRNTIIAGNTQTGGGGPDVNGTVQSAGYNIVGNNAASSGWVASDQQNVSPMLGALASNGGFTMTHALQVGSPAINAGTSTGAPLVDQRDYLRDAQIDIGAFEYNGTAQSVAANSLAVASDDAAVTAEDNAVIVNVTANDTDANGDAVTVIDVTGPANGSASAAGGSVTYTPDVDYSGADSFEYLAVDAGAGLAHYWGLAGNATDAVGSANGVLVNGPTTVAGRFGDALSFDETDDRVVVPDIGYTNSFAVAMSFKVDDNSGSGYQYLYSHGAFGTNNSLNILIGESGSGGDANKLIFGLHDANDSTAGLSLNIDIGGLVGDSQWHTLAVTVESGVGSKFYVDGVLRAMHANGGDAFDPTGSVYFGAREDLSATRFYGGALDSVMVFDRTLRAAEVSGLAFELNRAAVAVTVNPVADTPSVTNAVTAEDTQTTSGLVISRNAADGAEVSHFKITGISGGTLYQNDGTTVINNGDFVTLAQGDAGLKFTPSPNSTAGGGFDVRASTAGNDSGLGGSVVSATITVNAVNDAPSISNGATVSLTGTDENTTSSATTVNSILTSASWADVDSGPLKGIAVTAVTGNGSWEYSTDGISWTNFGAVSGSSALLLDSASQVRYVPDGQNGETATFGFRAWDQTTGVASSNGSPSTANPGAGGGSSAYSSESASAAIVVSAVNDAPSIGGTVAGQAVNDTGTVNPFAGVTIGDADNPAQTLDVSVTLDASAKGTFSTLNGFVDAGGGVYTFSGTAAAATAAIQGLVFDPADNRVTPGNTETTSFTISVNDGSGPVTDATTTVVSTSVNDAPSIGGTLAGQAVNDTTTINPFAGVSIGDVDSPAQTLDVSVTLDAAAKGVFSTLNGFTDAGGGIYTFSGTAAAATAAIQGLVFDPADNRVTPGLSETTTFTISVNDGSGPVTDNTTTVVSTSVNDAPSISGTLAGQAVNDTATINPFAAVSIGDVDNPAQTLSVSVTLDTAAKGAFSTLNGFTDAGGGLYTFSGTAAAATTAIQGLVLDPADNRVTPGNTETTTFTISVNDGSGPVTDNTTTVVSTSVNDAPSVSGTLAGQAVNDTATLNPFASVSLGDADNPAQTLTVSVALDAAAKGTFSTLNGFTDAGGGVYTFSGTAAAATTAIQGLVFDPADNRVAPGNTETTTFTITVNDGGGPVSDATTTVVSTSVNDAPVAVDDSDLTDEDTVLSVAVAGVLGNDSDLDGGALVVSAVEGNTVNVGSPVLLGSGALLTLNADGSFDYDPNGAFEYLGAGESDVDTFTYELSDGNGGLNTATVSITIDGVNDAPGGGDATVVIDEDGSYIFTTADFGFADADASDSLQGLRLVSLPGAGSLSLSGAAVGAGQLISAADLMLGHLVYTPAADANGVGYASFDFRVNDGTVDAPVANTLTVDVTAVNDAPSLTQAGAQNVNEDAGAQSVGGFANALPGGGGDEAGQTLSYSVSNDNNALFSVQPGIDAAGNLTYTLAADASGVANVTVLVSDNGGTANGGADTSAAQLFTITVNAVNDAPTLTIGANQSLAEDAGAQSMAGFAAAAPGGGADEAGQALSYVVSNDNNALFALQPALDAAGNLVYTPAPNASGVANVTVLVGDNGGTANGGVDSSAAQTFTVTVNPVNDAPLLGANVLSIGQGGVVVLGAANLSASDVDDSAGGLMFSVSNVLHGRFELVSAPGAAIAGFSQADLTGALVRFVHDGSGTAAAYAVRVSDGLLSDGPQAARISFTPGALLVVPPAPVLVPVVNPPPAPAIAPAPAPEREAPAGARAGVTGAVFSPGRIDPPEAQLNEYQAQPLRLGRAYQPVATLNHFTPGPHIDPTLELLAAAPANLEYLSTVPVDWTSGAAFPDAEETPRDRIDVLLEQVQVGGMALSVGVVWWASRISGLLGSLLASAPAWRHIDPLPVVGRDEDEEKKWYDAQDRDADANELAIDDVFEGARTGDGTSRDQA